jgi:glycosyltransferase involved in cell wall biosynthesis
MRADLEAEGFERCVPWTRGVDTRLFVPREESVFDLPRPIMLYVGRVAVEKNLPAFLELEREGSKVVVGSGPDLEDLRSRYPHAHFVGPRFGEELARAYASADVFVFPSKTDTFGLVMLEALACGVPVAAYPVTGPLDVIGDSGAGALDESLWRAIECALEIEPATCRAHAQRFSWAETALTMRRHLAPLR